MTLLRDAHEWINEIPTVPIYHLANPQPRERALEESAGKEDPVELDSILGLYADCISGHIMILELNVKGVGLIYDDGV
ncbi:hypothetical protein BLNAU_7391 [Blattamonas nauphoetae]|uniref:Uncharacterized protein n=1 Tax=Blattamonas nauphoetae TaxID=2049346 RepID=A0ABQ9Y1W6_9EUKA|nr:hypothetical protein BLNAU_7391 [Blattamonas nauphoetae]